MSAKAPYFLDTNILVYAFEQNQSEKKHRARQLLADEQPWHISWQVVQEFCHVAIHRFRKPLAHDYLVALIDLLLAPHSTVAPGRAIWTAALKIHRDTQYHFYDSLIVAAAIESGATTLYSEDLQHGRRIGDLTILNPFL